MVETDSKFSAARRRLREKSQAPKDQTIISVLRILRPDIEEMLRAGHRGTAVYHILNESWDWSQRGFYDAWHVFLKEIGWTEAKPVPARPAPTGLVRPCALPTPARPTQITPAYTPAQGSALEALQRLSVTDLLKQST